MNLEGRLSKWSKVIRGTMKKRKLKKKGAHRIKHIGDTGRGGKNTLVTITPIPMTISWFVFYFQSRKRQLFLQNG